MVGCDSCIGAAIGILPRTVPGEIGTLPRAMPGETIARRLLLAPGTDAFVMLREAIAAGNGAAGNGAAACCCINACLPSWYAAPMPVILASLMKYGESH